MLARKGVRRGEAAVTRCRCATRPALTALEAVNADFHKFDVFVLLAFRPRRAEEPKIMRPQMVAFQDIYSGRIRGLADGCQNPNSTAVLLAAGDMINGFGHPGTCAVGQRPRIRRQGDHRRQPAPATGSRSRKMTFRACSPQLGCTIHWATPYQRSSPSRSNAPSATCVQSIAKDPRLCRGLYRQPPSTPNPRTMAARPFRSGRVPELCVAEGIEEHNTRQGRRSEVALGRSPSPRCSTKAIPRPPYHPQGNRGAETPVALGGRPA